MNSYEAKQEAKRERLERAAERARAESDARFTAAHNAVAGIPFGQPILVGHHSEKRHRGAIDRMARNMDRGCERADDARELARRADAVGTGGISSDDPDAVPKLREKLAALEGQRARMKTVNALYRKADRAGLAALGLEYDALAAKMAGAYSWEKAPYPSYSLTNLGARIRDVQKRIADLSRVPELAATAPAAPIAIGAATITEDMEEMRVLIRFPARLSKPAYQVIRAHGFVWAPTRNAFVRKFSPATLAGVAAAAGRAAAAVARLG